MSGGFTITDENGEATEEYMGMPGENYDEDNPEIDLGGDYEGSSYGDDDELFLGGTDDTDDEGEPFDD